MVDRHNMRAVRVAHPKERTVTYQAPASAIRSVYLHNSAEAQVAISELLDGAILILNIVERTDTGLCDSVRLCGFLIYVGTGVHEPYKGVKRSFHSRLPDILFVTYEHVGLLQHVAMDVPSGNARLLVVEVAARSLVHTEVKCQVMEHIRNRALEEVLHGCLGSDKSLDRAEKRFVTLIVIGDTYNQTYITCR